MKLVVLGDLHLGGGYSLGRIDPYKQLNTRLIDHSNTFDHVVDFMVDHGVEHLALTGDIYEHRRPEASQMALFSEKLARLTDLGIHTHIVAGNHDIVRAHKATTMDKFRLLRLPMVHVYNDIESHHCIGADGNGINLVFLPFRTRQMLQCWSNGEAVAFLKERLQFEKRGFGNDNPAVIVGHLTLQGAQLHGTALEEHAVFDIVMPPDAFDGFEAVFMGHVHQFQVLSKDPLIAHVGSMERTDFGEADQPKMFVMVEVSKGRVACEFVALPVKSLCDIVIDRTADHPDGMMDGIKAWLRTYASRSSLVDSIARVTITVSDAAAHAVDTAEIMRFLLRDLAVSNCVGVHAQIVSKRQLRDATITEKSDPLVSLNKWLELNVADPATRDEMAKAGASIIEGSRR